MYAYVSSNSSSKNWLYSTCIGERSVIWLTVSVEKRREAIRFIIYLKLKPQEFVGLLIWDTCDLSLIKYYQDFFFFLHREFFIFRGLWPWMGLSFYLSWTRNWNLLVLTSSLPEHSNNLSFSSLNAIPAFAM